MNKIQDKTAQLVEYFLQKIKSEFFKSGEKLPTERELQNTFNLSRSTIRKAYNILVKKGVVVSKQGSGYYLSQNYKSIYAETTKGKNIPSSKQNIKIGVLFPEKSPFFDDLYTFIKIELNKRNYEHELLFNTSTSCEKDAFTKFIKEGYSGVIFSPNRSYFDDFYKNYDMLYKYDLPFVIIGKPPKNIFCNSVYYDDVAGCISLVKYLYYNKCKQVIFITSLYSDTEALIERKEGFIFGMKKFYPDNEKNIFNINQPNFSNKLSKYLTEATEKIGIILYDNYVYKMVEEIVSPYKKIGQDIIMIGFNSPAYNYDKKISSIEHNMQLLSEKSIDLLETIFKHKNTEMEIKHNILKPDLIIR